MKNEWSAGKIVALILGCFLGFLILGIAFIVSAYQLSCFMTEVSEAQETNQEEEYDEYDSYEEEEEEIEEFDYDRNEWEEDFSNNEEYYEFENDINTDLSYQITFEEYYRDDLSKDEEIKIELEMKYPVISGEVTNLNAINEVIYGEIEAVEEFLTSYDSYLSSNDEYIYTGEAYITYMTEEILSIAYVEYGYLNGEYVESYVISFNMDMQTGMILQNSHLLDIDDEFSIEFRERCEKQNGEIDGLSYFSDQDITMYLTDDSSLIIFYTPIGMEIGLNYYDGWVTVTYPDYEKYQKQF